MFPRSGFRGRLLLGGALQAELLRLGGLPTLALLLAAGAAVGQEPAPAAGLPDSAWRALRPSAQASLFQPLPSPSALPPGPSLYGSPLLVEGGPNGSSTFWGGLAAVALSRAACGPNRVCRFYMEGLYRREYGQISGRADWLGSLLGRALLPEFRRRGLELGAPWWREVRRRP